VQRVRLEAEALLKDTVARARAESEAELEEQVARATAETKARLEAQLADAMNQAEQQLQHAEQEKNADADRIRTQAALAARAAAEAALAEETARIRAEADQRLASEIARLRAEAAAQMAAGHVQVMPAIFAEPGADDEPSIADVSRTALKGIRWDYVATAGVILLVIITGALYLPRAVKTAARTSSALVDTAGAAAKNVAKEAVAAAPVVTRRAFNAAERAIPHPDVVSAKTDRVAAGPAPPVADAPAVTGPGFVAAFARIPMEVYADGKRIGTTEDGQLLLPSGKHRMEFVSERFHYRSAMTMTVRPGLVQPYTVTLPSADVRITTTPGAEVFVEGERVGVAPLAPVQVPIGTREIVVRDATGESRQAVEVRYGETAEVSLTPQRAQGEGAPATPHLAPLSRPLQTP
jgi:hypothetical protein